MQASVSDTQLRLQKLDPSDASYRPLLRELLDHQDLKPHIQSLPGSNLEGFIELLDKALSRIPATDDLFHKTLRRLQSTCGNRGVLPRSHLISSERLSKRGNVIVSGGFADVSEAELDGQKVCVEVLRSHRGDTAGVTEKTFYGAVVVWKRLQHPNIVPFLGVPTNTPSPLEIVCEWMEDGAITEYVRKNPEIDRIGLLWDVADGLHYLHSSNIVHGDLKGENVLIDKDGHARLTGFWLTSIIPENSVPSPKDSDLENTRTWAAPEILRGEPVSKEGDVFTFAMVAIEIFTGHAPFLNTFPAAVFDIMAGKRPPRPETLRHDGLWKIIERCWSQEPMERPTASQLSEFFRTSFSRERETPKTPAFSGAASVWTLVGADRDARPRGDLSIKGAQTYGIELQDMRNPSKSSSIDESADPLFPPGPGDGTPADPRQRVTDPPANGPPDLQKNLPHIPGERPTMSSSLFGQLRNAYRTVLATVTTIIFPNRERNGRIPVPAAEVEDKMYTPPRPLRNRYCSCF